MAKEQKITTNIKTPNPGLEVLKKHFSHCFDKNGQFDIEKFQQDLAENEVDFYKESYGLDWLGKSYARILASDEATTLLKEDEAFNQKPENKNSQNLLIKGDNLEVLKHLVNAYYEKVKMIYIDPPYNTGSDGFVYQDDRKFTVKELHQLAGVDEEKAKRILDFTQSKSNSHSAWLTFMYPRLYIAKQLLKEDGVIFISIDDNEVAQLKILMDEIYGDENFLGKFIVKSTPNARNYGHMGKMHEYCIMYCKDSSKTVTYEIDTDVEFDFKDDLGGFNIHPLYNSDESFHIDNRPNLHYPIYVDPTTEDEDGLIKISTEKTKAFSVPVYPPLSTKNKVQFVWRWEKKKAKDGCNSKIIGYRNEDGEIRIVRKMRHTSRIVRSMLLEKKFSGRRGTAEVESLFNSKVFTFPKPIELIHTLLRVATRDDDMVLDFFSGSGTTGHAMMQLNSEDGNKRKFILVQLPEILDKKKDKVGYAFVREKLKVDKPTIFEITKERLIRAAKKIKDENIITKIGEKEAEIKSLSGQLDLDNKEDKISTLQSEIEALKNQDLRFKIYETMPIWEDYGLETDELDQQTKLFDESKLKVDDLKALLITWKTYDGMSLSEDLTETDLDGYTGYYGNDNLYLMDKGFETKHLKSLLEKIDSDKKFSPTSIIAFGYHFDSKNLREISENIKSYANKKNIDIDFLTRY